MGPRVVDSIALWVHAELIHWRNIYLGRLFPSAWHVVVLHKYSTAHCIETTFSFVRFFFLKVDWLLVTCKRSAEGLSDVRPNGKSSQSNGDYWRWTDRVEISRMKQEEVDPINFRYSQWNQAISLTDDQNQQTMEQWNPQLRKFYKRQSLL